MLKVPPPGVEQETRCCGASTACADYLPAPRMPTAWPEREPRTQTLVAKQCGGGGVTGSANEASRTKPKGGSRGLTFELSRAVRQTALAARSHDELVRSAARAGCRSASALERGVRPHSVSCKG